MQARLVHDLPLAAAERAGEAPALTSGGRTWSYAELGTDVEAMARSLRRAGLERSGRVGIFTEKRQEGVVATFAATRAGGAFVPLNPVLKPPQVDHVLRDCAVTFLVTTRARLRPLRGVVAANPHLRGVVLADGDEGVEPLPGIPLLPWSELLEGGDADLPRGVDDDMAAILYTSGSTGRPKGVVLSHRNMVVGAESVAAYLENDADDTLLAALPLSFDAGLSQLTTAFSVGARVVLLNHLLPRDVVRALERERVTGLTGVPALWRQIARLEWPDSIRSHLRYVANTGGKLSRATLGRLRALLPDTRVYLMYGLTEAFRATYLPPEELDRRPDSIGKAIPNAQVLVLRPDGTRCEPGEAGELVQRGALVAQGYWNDPERTAERFRPLPEAAGARPAGIVRPETAVFSGDVVRADDDGYLYFVGRRDAMIKTSGYRVSPTEVEEVLYASGRVAECAALGIPHGDVGHVIEVVVKPAGVLDVDELLAHCRRVMPPYMVPVRVHLTDDDLPRNSNGKIDRAALLQERVRSAAAAP